MLSGTLLPAHLHPLPEELLSSWLVRLAHAHGLKLQTFCDLVFGKPLQVWNRDIDRYAPLWLLDALADLTATPIERVWQTTVAAYEGVVFPQQNATGVQRWTLCAGMYHRTRLMHWLQTCPACLAEGPVPYYRRPWRLAFMTCCARHRLQLIDACPQCGAGIAFFRGELGRPRQRDVVSLSRCHACQFDLATSGVEVEHDAGLRWVSEWLTEPADLAAEMLGVLHQLVRLMLAGRRQAIFYRALSGRAPFWRGPPVRSRTYVESLRLEDRRDLVSLAVSVMRSPEQLAALLRQRALRHNELLKDFHDPAPRFRTFVAQLPQRARSGTSARYLARSGRLPQNSS